MTRTGRCALALATLMGIGACDPAELPVPQSNNVCDEPTVQVLLSADIEESSGVATSRAHEGVFWTHNDSGWDANLFAIDTTGAILARVRVEAATNRDWEDLELAPCEPGSDHDCLFIGEIGDNNEHHANVAVYRIPEPDPATDSVSAPADIFRFTYPEGPRDAESLFVTDAGIHVVNKGRSHAIELFRLSPPYRPGTTAVIERVQELAPPPNSLSAQVTAAAADRAGDRVVIRTYAGLRFFLVDADTLRPDGRHADMVAPDQRQGEAVDFIDSQRFVLTSETRGAHPASLAIVTCDPSRPPHDSTPGR